MANLQNFYTLSKEGKIPGFFVMSTAPINVDENENMQHLDDEIDLEVSSQGDLVDTIVDKVIERSKSHLDTDKDKAIDLVVAIHGYNTRVKSVKGWYQEILNQVNEEKSGITPHAVFIGYRWPSESMFSNFSTLLDSLPVGIFPFPQIASFLIAPLVGIILTSLIYFLSLKALIFVYVAIILLSIFYFRKPRSEARFKDWTALASIALALAVILFFPKISLTAIELLPQDLSGKLKLGLLGVWSLLGFLFLSIPTFGLMLLRLSAYPRDSFRATQFAIPDLVDLFSKLDLEISKKLEAQPELCNEQKCLRDEYRIKLSFICHSMGAFVTTGTVRILSDVFDSNYQKKSGANIGHIFCLKRLILVSPDISDLALSANRANYLKSSLRRFEEAYLFSNQGDMALLFASTAANYFSFPTLSRFSGRRLGNLGIYADRNNKKAVLAGIVNLEKLESTPQEPLQNFLNANRLEPCLDFNVPEQRREEISSLVNLFTYFDCTDFRGNYPTEIMSFGLPEQPWKRFWQELRLLWVWLVSKSIDVHGGYFDYETTRFYMYNLAFGGFQCLLNALERQSGQEMKLNKLNEHLKTHGIRVALSPERYLVDIKEKNFPEVRDEILRNT
jgi:hypothetical protein